MAQDGWCCALESERRQAGVGCLLELISVDVEREAESLASFLLKTAVSRVFSIKAHDRQK